MITAAEKQAISEAVGIALRTAKLELRADFRKFVAEQIRQLPEGPPGKAGADGRDGNDGPPGKDGEPGQDGKDGSPGERGMDGAPGHDGRDGVDGKDGSPGRDGIDGVEGKEGVSGAPGTHGRDGIDGKDGLSGKDGERGVDGTNGRDGVDGLNGKDGGPGRDGKSVELSEVENFARHVMEGHVAEWALDFERRAQELFQRAIERMPLPKDGRDGFGFEDLDVTHDGDGNVTLLFKRGELEKAFTIRLPRQRFKGIYKQGEPYREGDDVTFDGSRYTALEDNPTDRPGTGKGWQLSVKKGRDGKDLRPAEPPQPNGPIRLK